jgi:hypothetical protein
MQRLLPLLTVFSLVFAASGPAHATTPRTRTEYVVKEINPVTNGAVRTERFADRNAANQFYATLSKAHWVKWRFAGINEPLRFRRFSSSFLAQRFIDDNGPSKSGALGIAVLTNETRNVPTKVTLTTVTVPVTGPGNGRGNPGPDVVEVIDRIIGIIGR